MNLIEAVVGEEYEIKNIHSQDEEMNTFLFSLGCYSGESITVVSKRRHSYVVAIKDSRYNIDDELASVIEV